MTREQAKRVLEFNLDHTHNNESKKALRMAIKALKQHLEQQTCEDAISREDALMALTGEWHESRDEILSLAIRRIRTLPSVNPQPKTGHWEWVQYDSNPNIGNWHCSECRCVVVECVDKKSEGGIPLYKYCPQCGCRIVEPQESEV